MTTPQATCHSIFDGRIEPGSSDFRRRSTPERRLFFDRQQFLG
ncbi:hypothetical protein M6B38_306605 [Iris pallida]|uniref:Uncharacterized protein n=1 Tax=Iris pallida TaxID=29817 RepID=A0AAX6HLU5_IRIPA|nr:hypothetical protein M6B38_306605 [Iris pallida]